MRGSAGAWDLDYIHVQGLCNSSVEDKAVVVSQQCGEEL
jgi:hypothetical protein